MVDRRPFVFELELQCAVLAAAVCPQPIAFEHGQECPAPHESPFLDFQVAHVPADRSAQPHQAPARIDIGRNALHRRIFRRCRECNERRNEHEREQRKQCHTAPVSDQRRADLRIRLKPLPQSPERAAGSRCSARRA